METLNVDSCPFVIAPDSTLIRELLSPTRVGIEANVRYSLAHGSVMKGRRTRRHRLRSSSETYYILSGNARFSVEENSVEVGPGSIVYIPPQAWQHVENIGESNLQYLVICDPAWMYDEVEVKESIDGGE